MIEPIELFHEPSFEKKHFLILIQNFERESMIRISGGIELLDFGDIYCNGV